MTDRGSQSDLNSRAGLPDRPQTRSSAHTSKNQGVLFPHLQDRAALVLQEPAQGCSRSPGHSINVWGRKEERKDGGKERGKEGGREGGKEGRKQASGGEQERN